MTFTSFPAFLWADNGHNFSEDDLYEGFFRGFYIEWVCVHFALVMILVQLATQVTRHIFTGPSTGMGGDACGTRRNNLELNFMDQVGGAQLAYAAVQVPSESRSRP